MLMVATAVATAERTLRLRFLPMLRIAMRASFTVSLSSPALRCGAGSL